MTYQDHQGDPRNHPLILRFIDVLFHGFEKFVHIYGDNLLTPRNPRLDAEDSYSAEDIEELRTEGDYETVRSKWERANPFAIRSEMINSYHNLKKLETARAEPLRNIARTLCDYFERDIRPLLDNFEELRDIYRNADRLKRKIMDPKQANRLLSLYLDFGRLIRLACGIPAWCYAWEHLQGEMFLLDAETTAIQSEHGFLKLKPETPEYGEAFDRLSRLALMAINSHGMYSEERREAITSQHKAIFGEDYRRFRDSEDRTDAQKRLGILAKVFGGEVNRKCAAMENELQHHLWIPKFRLVSRRFSDPLELVSLSTNFLDRALELMAQAEEDAYRFDGRTTLWFYAIDALQTPDPLQAFRERTSRLDTKPGESVDQINEKLRSANVLHFDWLPGSPINMFSQAFNCDPLKSTVEERERIHGGPGRYLKLQYDIQRLFLPTRI